MAIILKSFIISLILSQQICGKFVDDYFTPYEPFPFTLIKTQGGIKFPTDLQIRRNLFGKTKILFYHANFLKQLVFCPAHLKEDIKLIAKANRVIEDENANMNEINDDCLFIEKSFGQTFTSPYPKCARQPEPVILKVFQTNSKDDEDEGGDPQQTCGPGGVFAKQYEIGYQLCFKLGILRKLYNFVRTFKKSQGFPLEDVVDYPMYRFCYEIKNKRTVYTKHRLSSPRLLWNPEMQQERDQCYKMDTNSFNFSELEFEQIKNKYKKIENETNQKSEQSNEDIPSRKIRTPFKIQRLVPSNDFSFAILRQATFHFANTQLMHENLIEYWDYINEFVRYNAIQYNREFTIYTGAFTISDEGSDEIITMEGIQIPQIWVQIIDNSYIKRIRDPQYYFKKYITHVIREGIAIIANNYFTENIMEEIKKSYCKKNLCEDFGAKKFPEVHGFILCCPVTENIQDLFGIKLKINSIYKIEGLVR